LQEIDAKARRKVTARGYKQKAHVGKSKHKDDL